MTATKTIDLLAARIEALRSKQKRVGPYRAGGIQLSIDNFKTQIAALRAMEASNGQS